jgi:hypothetical protein
LTGGVCWTLLRVVGAVLCLIPELLSLVLQLIKKAHAVILTVNARHQVVGDVIILGWWRS